MEFNNDNNQNDAKEPSIAVNFQYIKDLSFENPDAPMVFTVQNEQPKIALDVDVEAARIDDNHYEVAIHIEAKANFTNKTLYVVDLVYAGIFTVENIPEQDLEFTLLGYCPNVIFPFARRVVADVTRDGGYLPLMVDPINFGALYYSKKQQEDLSSVN